MPSASQNLTNLISSLPTASSHFRSAMQSATSDLDNALATARKAGVSRHAQEMLNQKKLSMAMNKFQQKYLQAQSSGDTLRMSRLEEGFKKEMKHIKVRLESHEEANKIMQDGVENFIKTYQSGLLEGAEAAADKLGEGFGNLKDNLSNLDVKGFGSMLKGGGQGLKNMGGAMGGNMGKMVGQLGKVVAGIGAVVGVLGVFAAVMMEADKKAKEMNSTIMEGVSVFDLGVEKSGQLNNRMYELRQQAFDVGSEFRLAAEDVTQLQNSFLKAGMTFKEFEQFAAAGDSITGLEDALRSTLTMSRLLGMDAQELAETYTKMNEDFGLDMSQIENAFRDIYTAANLSSIGTQKFTAMITQATGSMALFNVDFSETAALASEFIEALGEEGASDLLQNLSGKFGKMGYQERMKTNMLSGGGVRKGLKAGFEQGALRLEKGAAGDQIEGILTTMGMSGEKLSDAILKMSAEQQRELVDRASMSGMDDAFVRQLQTVTIQGNALNTGVEKGMGALDAGSTLSIMQSIAENFGGGDMRKIGTQGMMVLEEVTGMSGQELDNYTRVIDKMRGQYEGIERQFKDLEKMDPSQRAEAVKKIEEEYKVTIGEDGQMINMQTGEEIKSLREYLASMSTPTDLESALTKDQELAQEAVSETRTLGAIMENTIGSILDSIYQVLVGWMSFSRDANESQQLTDFLARLKDAKSNLIEQRTEIKTRLRTDDTLTEEDKTKLKEQLETIRGQMRVVDASVRRAPSQGSGFFGDYADSQEEMLSKMAPMTQDIRGKYFEKYAVTGYETRFEGEGGIKSGGKTRVDVPIYENVGEDLSSILDGAETDAVTLSNSLVSQKGTEESVTKGGELYNLQNDTKDGVQSLLTYMQTQDVATALGVSRSEAMKIIESERKGKTGTAEAYFDSDKYGNSGSLSVEDYNERRDNLVAAGLISGSAYKRKAKAEDFLYQGDSFGRGTITPFNTKDEVLFGKQGGALQKAFGGGGGGNVVVNVHVNATDRSMGQSIAKAVSATPVLNKIANGKVVT